MTEPRKFRRPAMLDPRLADDLPGDVDPAVRSELAHETAGALVARARAEAGEDPAVVERLLRLVETEGIDAVASMWAQAPAETLPGALWRLYLLREWVRSDPTLADRYRLGVTRARVQEVVAGAAQPPGPAELRQLADDVLSGVFTGELDVALDRAAAFSRILAVGAAMDADWIEETAPDRANQVTRRASALLRTGEDLERAAARWRAGTLD